MPTTIKKNAPIGVFDSGLGGLTVMKALRRLLPSENIVYFGDTARVPYGTKSPESIVRFSRQNARILLDHGVKMVVVACNSSSSHALPVLRRTLDVPVLGVIEPGVKKALAVSRKRVIGVIATPATIHSGAYRRELVRRCPGVKVVGQACPLFVPLVEEGWFNREVTRKIAAEYLQKVRRCGADALILGCTHYPLLKTVIRKVLGPRVELVDSASEVALEVKARLEKEGLAAAGGRRGSVLCLVSDQPRHFRDTARRFLGYDIARVRRCTV